MRGHIDLKSHKLAGLYRAPARKVKRTAMPKCPDAAYRQLWHLADGAVRDCFANHPDYLTAKGKHHARLSLVKRITGTMHGYATQVAKGGYETRANVARGDSAITTAPAPIGPVEPNNSVWVLFVSLRNYYASLWRRGKSRRPKFSGAPQ